MVTGRWSVALMLVTALTGTACAGGGGSASSGGVTYGSSSAGSSARSAGPSSTGSPTPSGGGGYGHDGGNAGGAGGGAGKSVATVTQSNYRFTPSTLKVASGDIITLKNSTPSPPHTFTVDGQHIDVAMGPASTQIVKIDLAAGTYPFHCRYHESQGMSGTLTVT